MQHVNWQEWSRLLKEKREQRGFQTAKQFLKSISHEYPLSDSIYYRIESGKRVPTADEFLALNYLVFGNIFPYNVMYQVMEG